MVAESFACPACAEVVPPGRLSCPQCGTVLAAVARSYREPGQAGRPVGAPTPAARAERSWLDPVPSSARSPQPLQEAPMASEAALVAAEPAPADPSPPLATPVAAFLGSTTTGGWPPPARWAQLAGEGAADVDTAVDAAVEPSGAHQAGPLVPSRSIPAVLHDVDEEPPGQTQEPAAYRPPTVPSPTASMPAARPAIAEPPARILPRAWDRAAATGIATAAGEARGNIPDDAAKPARRRPALPSLDRGRVDEVAGVIVLGGAMAASIGFLLPWSRVMIGARSAGGYFDSWGLAGPGHLVVFGLALLVLGLAATPNRVGTWLRTGVAGVGLGALLFGLVWPYAFGPLGTSVGTVLEVVAAVLLLTGGLLSSLAQRHADPSPGV